MTSLLDNIMWSALSGPQAKFSVGTDTARRFAPGFSPIVGFSNAEHPDFNALAPFCEPGEPFYCDRWSGTAPAGWQVDFEGTMFKMVWQGPLPEVDEAPEASVLDAANPAHVAQAMELAALTKPGPFGPRTIELGEYFGVFDNGRLMAMAGERMEAGTLREISGVCTHPDFQGKGLARRLMLKLIRRQMQRGLTPFLHVMGGNTGARQLYERMGFNNYLETVVRVISRTNAA